VSVGSHATCNIASPTGRLLLLFARPAVTLLDTERHHVLAGTKLYCLVAETRLTQNCYLTAI